MKKTTSIAANTDGTTERSSKTKAPARAGHKQTTLGRNHSKLQQLIDAVEVVERAVGLEEFDQAVGVFFDEVLFDGNQIALGQFRAAVLAELQAARRFFDGKTPQTSVPADYLSTRGNFTVVFPARATQTGLSSAEFPQGDGIGTVRITANGVLTLKGTLADGTPIVTTAPIAQDLRSPLFAKLYKSQGAIAGVLTLDSTRADSDLTGDNLRWIRPAAASLKHYPNGWPSSILLDLVGAKYASVPGTRVLAGLVLLCLLKSLRAGEISLHLSAS
jgi:hypothetical protein